MEEKRRKGVRRYIIKMSCSLILTHRKTEPTFYRGK